MAARVSAKKLPRRSLEFKRKAVKLTQVPRVEVQAVVKGLDLHPVMLSRWRQEARLGRLRGRTRSHASRRSRCGSSSGCSSSRRSTNCCCSTSSQKCHTLHFGTKGAAFAFVQAQGEGFEVKRMCRLLGVSHAGYYAWRVRGASARSEEGRRLVDRIREVFRRSPHSYGSPRVQRELKSRGVRVSRRRVERLMRAAGCERA